jgi:ubiquinone/menaquinone biosynthesis C-methylase UbiE
MQDIMPHTDLVALLLPQNTIERNGIYIAKGIAEKTVWDTHALDNPQHAVVSAPNEEAVKLKSSAQIADIKSHLNPDDILLDYGCGYGRVAQYVLPDMSLKGYIGLDSSHEMLNLFKQRYTGSELEQKTPLLLVNADIHTVPLSDKSVDAVVVSAVFLHNHKDVVAKSLEEIKRVLKPGGTFLVYSSFPRAATAMGMQGWAYQIILNLLGKPFKNGPVRYYRKGEVVNLFREFSEVDIIPVEFTVIPKTLIFLPGPLERVWRVGFANPINRFLENIMPNSLKHYFAVHFDVVAKR